MMYSYFCRDSNPRFTKSTIPPFNNHKIAPQTTSNLFPFIKKNRVLHQMSCPIQGLKQINRNASFAFKIKTTKISKKQQFLDLYSLLIFLSLQTCGFFRKSWGLLILGSVRKLHRESKTFLVTFKQKTFPINPSRKVQ